jgi:putative transposase
VFYNGESEALPSELQGRNSGAFTRRVPRFLQKTQNNGLNKDCQFRCVPLARNFVGRKKNFVGQHFWAQGYHVSTIGRDEEAIRKYIKEQEAEDRRIDQLNLFDE